MAMNLQPITGHPAYPGKTLEPVTNEQGNFTCYGCNERGSGNRYKVDKDLFHICCAVRPKLGKLKLKFYTNPPENTLPSENGGNRRVCAKCNKAVNRFVYHGSSGYYHPCCACKQQVPNLCKCSLPTTTENAMTDSMQKHKSPWKKAR